MATCTLARSGFTDSPLFHLIVVVVVSTLWLTLVGLKGRLGGLTGHGEDRALMHDLASLGSLGKVVLSSVRAVLIGLCMLLVATLWGLFSVTGEPAGRRGAHRGKIKNNPPRAGW